MVKKEEFQTFKYYSLHVVSPAGGLRFVRPHGGRQRRDRSPEHRAGRPGAAHTGASKERTPDRGPAPPAASNPRVRPSTAYPPVVDAPPPGPGPRTRPAADR